MPSFLDRLIAELAKLPGLGPKSAERVALHLLKRDQTENDALATAIRDLKATVHPCRICGNYAETDLCDICSNPSRDPTLLCVVEEPRYIRIIEKTGVFKGLYHVLGGTLSPVHGIGPEQLDFPRLRRRIEEGGVTELILALNQTAEAELTGLYIAQNLKPLGLRISRLTTGVPVGADLEFVDILTLSKSFESRQNLT